MTDSESPHINYQDRLTEFFTVITTTDSEGPAHLLPRQIQRVLHSNYYDRFPNSCTVIVTTDSDSPGQELARQIQRVPHCN